MQTEQLLKFWVGVWGKGVGFCVADDKGGIVLTGRADEHEHQCFPDPPFFLWKHELK